MNKRWWLWLPLLATGLWLALFGDRSPAGNAVPSEPVRPTGRDSRTPVPAPAAHEASVVALVPREALVPPAVASAAAAATPRDPFSSRSWNPPPAPPPPAPPPPPPSAPPLPFAFAGKKLEGGTWEVYLTRGDSTFIVREGEVLAGSWRVDRAAPPLLTLTYLPLGQVQTLAIGETR